MLNGTKIIMVYKVALQLINNYYKSSFTFIILSSFFLIILDALSIVAIFPVVSLLFGAKENTNFGTFLFFENYFEVNFNVYLSLFVLTFLFILKFILTIISNYLISNFKMNLQKNISKSILREYLKKDYLDFLKIKYSDAVRIITKETEIFVNSSEAVIRIIVELAILIILFCVLLTSNFLLTLCSFLFLFIFSVVFEFLTKKKMERWGKQRLVHDGSRIKNLFQTMALISEIKLQNREEQFVKLFNQDNAITQRTQRNRTLISSFLRSSLELSIILIFVLSLTILMLLEANIISFLPTLTLFMVVIIRFLPGVIRIVNSSQLVKFSKVSFLELDSILNKKEDNRSSNQIDINNKSHIFKNHNCIELKNICFTYDNNKKNVLSDINLKINSGEIIGISGASGSGKSTLLSIIMGLTKPSKGMIYINDKSIYKNLKKYQNSIGYVSQEFSVVDTSVVQNITMKFDDLSYNQKKLDQVLEATNSKKFIGELKEGIYTNLGQSSHILSGGQKQRIAIARALYHFDEILILDEATNSIDQTLESEVMKNIKYMAKDKICLVVSHNKVSFDICGKIMRLNNCKIIEDTK